MSFIPPPETGSPPPRRPARQLFTASGKCAASADFAMTEPMCAAGTQLAVFWDAGQNGIHALYPDGSAAESATEGGVCFADVNETGAYYRPNR